MHNGNELQMLCITHLCSPHSFLHVLSTLYILDTMLIQMEPFFEAPTDKLTVDKLTASPPLAMKGPLARAQTGESAFDGLCLPLLMSMPKSQAYCLLSKDQQSYF